MLVGMRRFHDVDGLLIFLFMMLEPYFLVLYIVRNQRVVVTAFWVFITLLLRKAYFFSQLVNERFAL
ncbi:hypothetical protein KSF_085000 [Reticulibacter mediterranei]|uniref:Uncharacterized protein n=1 Tax=Reticulibacter mediterranei TaxID=2778369 RepID=A0A8J3N4Q3_9CHLR|nr:hypothetical protein KSF_085000 [Reticulibacter mediterranei]